MYVYSLRSVANLSSYYDLRWCCEVHWRLQSWRTRCMKIIYWLMYALWLCFVWCTSWSSVRNSGKRKTSKAFRMARLEEISPPELSVLFFLFRRPTNSPAGCTSPPPTKPLFHSVERESCFLYAADFVLDRSIFSLSSLRYNSKPHFIVIRKYCILCISSCSDTVSPLHGINQSKFHTS
jgi:hypothetical protein